MIPDWIVSRNVVILLAVIGALVSIAATVLRVRGRHSEAQVKTVNRIGYGFMWASIALFIYAGFSSGWS